MYYIGFPEYYVGMFKYYSGRFGPHVAEMKSDRALPTTDVSTTTSLQKIIVGLGE